MAPHFRAWCFLRLGRFLVLQRQALRLTVPAMRREQLVACQIIDSSGRSSAESYVVNVSGILSAPTNKHSA